MSSIIYFISLSYPYVLYITEHLITLEKENICRNVGTMNLVEKDEKEENPKRISHPSSLTIILLVQHAGRGRWATVHSKRGEITHTCTHIHMHMHTEFLQSRILNFSVDTNHRYKKKIPGYAKTAIRFTMLSPMRIWK